MRAESNGQSRATPSGLRERDSRLVHFDPLTYRAPARPRVRVHLHATGLWTSQAGPPFGSWFLLPGSRESFKAILFAAGGGRVSNPARFQRGKRLEEREEPLYQGLWAVRKNARVIMSKMACRVAPMNTNDRYRALSSEGFD